MKFIIYILGFLWIAAGAVAILYTNDFKGIIKGLMEKMDKKWLALIPSVFGLLLLAAASSTNYGWFIGLIGILGIVKGVLIYFNPAGLFDLSKTWLDTLTDQGYRLIGIIALILGTVVISWIK
jgi:uncharacterized membrane protein